MVAAKRKCIKVVLLLTCVSFLLVFTVVLQTTKDIEKFKLNFGPEMSGLFMWRTNIAKPYVTKYDSFYVSLSEGRTWGAEGKMIRIWSKPKLYHNHFTYTNMIATTNTFYKFMQ